MEDQETLKSQENILNSRTCLLFHNRTGGKVEGLEVMFKNQIKKFLGGEIHILPAICIYVANGMTREASWRLRLSTKHMGMVSGNSVSCVKNNMECIQTCYMEQPISIWKPHNWSSFSASRFHKLFSATSEEFLELVKSALLAALEALAPGSLFGLVTFSHKIGLYDVQGPVPVVKHIFIPPDLDGQVPIDLEDAMPLLSFLAPVENYKGRIVAALETIKPTTSWERTAAAGQGIDGVFLGGRGFGLAMDALINYLGSEYGNTFALAKVFSFLSGPPDYGAGQLDTRRYGEQYASKGEDAE